MESILNNPIQFARLVKENRYEEIYNLYGRDAYILFADIKYKHQDIKRLLASDDYVTLLNKYGFNQPFLSSKLNKHFKKLVKDGKYTEIINIYGYDFYESHKYKIIKSGLSIETGNSVKATGVVFKEMVKDFIRPILKYSYIAIFALNILAVQLRSELYEKSINEHQEVIDIYNEKLSKYVDNFKTLGLDNDLDIIMKVMSDMWEDINGYGNPNVEGIGFYRIAFALDNAPGVCRNMADDFVAKINAINPEYNARTLVVNADFSNFNNASSNVGRKYADNYVKSDFENEGSNILGNHMVATFDPIGKDYTLIVDPTNAVMGVIIDSKIYIFGTTEGKGFELRPVGQVFLGLDSSFSSIRNTFYKSFKLQRKQLDELNQQWGKEAQNKSLEKIKSKKF